MNKPIKDWTLGELKKECAEHDECTGCHFQGSAFCKQDGPAPADWDLSEQYRFTETEINVIRGIKLLHKDAHRVKITRPGFVILRVDGVVIGGIYLGGVDVFQAFANDETIEINDVLAQDSRFNIHK